MYELWRIAAVAIGVVAAIPAISTCVHYTPRRGDDVIDRIFDRASEAYDSMAEHGSLAKIIGAVAAGETIVLGAVIEGANQLPDAPTHGRSYFIPKAPIS